MFEEALFFTLKYEGCYSNDPHDTGGETVYGISRTNNPTWPGWPKIDTIKLALKAENRHLNRANIEQKIKNQPQVLEYAKALYKTKYWDCYNSLELPDQLHNKMFDYGVNAGPRTAILLLQKTLNALGQTLAEDGKSGPKTKAALKNIEQSKGLTAIINVYTTLQKARYHNWLNSKGSWATPSIRSAYMNRASFTGKIL